MNAPYSIHRVGQTARQMNTQQYIDWDQRRQANCVRSDYRDYCYMAARETTKSIRGASVADKVKARIDALHRPQAGRYVLNTIAVY